MRDTLVRLLERATASGVMETTASMALAGLKQEPTARITVSRPVPKHEVLEIYRRRERRTRKLGLPESNIGEALVLLEQADADSFLICSYSVGEETFLLFLCPEAERIAAVMSVKGSDASP